MRHARQAQRKAQAVLAHAPRVPREHLQTPRGDRHAIRALREPQVGSEQPNATVSLRLAALRVLRRSVRGGPVPRAHRDSALTQLIQRANSVQREATRLPKGAPSASRVQQEDLAARLGLPPAHPAEREASQVLMAQPFALPVAGEPSLRKPVQRTALRAPRVPSRIRRVPGVSKSCGEL